jgi:hypothetical protein
MISRKLGYLVSSENTVVAIILERILTSFSKRVGRPVWHSEETLLISRVEGNQIVFQHVLTPEIINSIVGPIFHTSPTSKKKLEENIIKLEAAIPDSSEMIRGMNNSAIAWNGKQWGLTDITFGGKLYDGNRRFLAGKLGTFIARDLGKELRIGITADYTLFDDPLSRFLLPVATLRPDRSSLRDFLLYNTAVRGPRHPQRRIMMGEAGAVEDTVWDHRDPGSGGGTGESADLSWLFFNGTATCAKNYTDQNACYGCCDSIGNDAFNAGLVVTAGITGTVAAYVIPATAPGGPLGVVLGLLVVGIVGSALLVASIQTGAAVTEACKRACNRPTEIEMGEPTVTEGLSSDDLT